MTVLGVTMVRDEEDIIASTLGNMLEQVDGIVVADNLSTDATPEILAELAEQHPGRLLLLRDDDPAYTQSEKMTRLARVATIEFGSGWIVPFDADEIWRSPHGRVGDVLEANVPAGYYAVPATLFDHYATALDDPAEPDPVKRLRWRRVTASPLPKVACRWRDDLVIHQGNHGASYSVEPALFDPLLEVRHFPYRSAEQLLRKVRNGAAAYRAAGDRVRADHGAHWRKWGKILDDSGPGAIVDLFETYYRRGATPHLDDDPMTEDPA